VQRSLIELLATREQLVENQTESVDVGTTIERYSRGLLGRHVRDGARQHPGVVRGNDVETFGEAEIRDVRLTFLVQQDVRGFQVAVEHAVRVGVVHGVCELTHELQVRPQTMCGSLGALLALILTARQHFTEVLARDQLHGEEGAAAVGSDVEDPHDVRVMQASLRFRAEQKAAQLRFSGEIRLDQAFERHAVLDVLRLRLEHDAHAATPELADQPVFAEPLFVVTGEAQLEELAHGVRKLRLWAVSAARVAHALCSAVSSPTTSGSRRQRRSSRRPSP
jgi:hypothetical protein